MPRTLRGLLLLAFVLAATVLAVSAALRLAANGIGCTPWPACYGQAATAAAANEATLARVLRPLHRVAATAFALAALGVVVAGWRHGPRSACAACIGLLVVTGLLAWIGRYTPSPLPAVTLANVSGGFALLALLAFVWTKASMPPHGGNARWPAATVVAGLLLAGVAAQANVGALVSARLAGDACASACSETWPAGAVMLADPFAPGAANDLLPRGGQPLQLWHRLGGLTLTLACAITAVVLLPSRRGRAAALLAGTVVTAGLGFVAAASAPTLPVTALHALGAGILAATLAALLAEAEVQEVPR